MLKESQEQALLFEWSEKAKCTYPQLKLLFAIPNGGSRHKLEAVNLKRQGVKSGVPDIMLPISRGEFNGLWIELKRIKGGTVSENQKEWIEALNNEGYCAKVCYGFDEAKDVILEYLKGAKDVLHSDRLQD